MTDKEKDLRESIDRLIQMGNELDALRRADVVTSGKSRWWYAIVAWLVVLSCVLSVFESYKIGNDDMRHVWMTLLWLTLIHAIRITEESKR